MHSKKKKNTSALSSTDVGKNWLGSDQLCCSTESLVRLVYLMS